jgi:preprotein translocase subunit SecD
MKKYYIMSSVALLLLFPDMAGAYVGPGLGAGTIAVIAGFAGSIILALFAVIWYPLKRVIRRLKGGKKGE